LLIKVLVPEYKIKMLGIFVLILIVWALYKLWKFGHWFFFVNVDENGQDPIGRWINNFFDRIYAQQEKFMMDDIRRRMTPEEREKDDEAGKRFEQYKEDAEKIREDIKKGRY
jgi:hypothetical protein